MACSSCREQIVHNLSETEANRFLTRLLDIKVDAEKEKQPDGKWLISVPERDSATSIKFLDSTRMFRQTRADADERSSVISTREDQRLRSERIVSQNIEDTLTSIAGVLEAHVHLNLPPADPLFGYRLNSSSGSASVLVVAGQELHLTKEEIISLITGASGIASSAVAVVISPESENPRMENRITEPHASVPQVVTDQVQATVSLFNPLLIFAALLLFASLGLGVWLWGSRRRVEGAA